MVWSTPLTAVANVALTAAQWNLSVRDNLLETGPAKATTAGAHFAVTGTGAIAERVPTEDVVDTLQTTTSQTFADLATVGPTVTVTTGAKCMIVLTAGMSIDQTNQSSRMSVDISGANVQAAIDARAARVGAASATPSTTRCSALMILSGLTPGSTTFTAKYRTSGSTSTSTFDQRRVSVLPF